jgi:hypothetical protein
MSRKITYHDNRLTVVKGNDHIVGKFIQMYDRNMENKTSEGEGLVFDWCEMFGIERNITGCIFDEPEKIVESYINECKKDICDNLN